MLRAFLARAGAIAALCVPVFGCSASDRAGSPSEAHVSDRVEALEAGADSGADSGTDPGADSGTDSGVDSGTDSGVDAGPTCTIAADCGNGCGVCSAGHCSIAPATAVCRPAAGLCDVDDTCDGTNKDCPLSDAKQPSTFICRPAVNPICDVAETCDGLSPACPADVVAPSTVLCRAAGASLCDVDDFCNGSGDCSADAKQPPGHICRAAADVCDQAEVCDGTSSDCPSIDAKKPAGTTCRPALPGDCDLEEACDGTSPLCPPDVFQPATHACRPASADSTSCDVAEYCSGADAICPPDSVAPNTVVCRAAAGPCDVTEVCDGASGACPSDGFKSASTDCRALSCANAALKPEIQCTGSSAACPVVADISCGNFACGSATACRATCITSDDCGPAFYCSNNDCIPRIGAGQKCKADAECPTSNNHCADGVCCDTTCTGQCEACNLAGTVGTCTGVKGDPVLPRDPCAADGTKCDGFCDPSNRTACQFPTSATSCRDAACDPASNAAVAESFCTGKGSCALSKSVACEPYVCSGAACGGNCTADAQCAKDAYCQTGICTPKGKLAAICTTDKQCGSGHCADGVCCDSACTGQCEACNQVDGADAGKCTPVTGAPVGKRTACGGTDATCGGSCDGKNRLTCDYPAQGKACRDAACSDGQATVTSYCNGHGACPALQTVSCEKGCEGTVCAGDECVLDSDCRDPAAYCAAGVCSAKSAPGSACSSAAGCQSGFCTDGVCCDSACLGQCEACDASGSMGTCSAVPMGDSPHGGRLSCTSDGSVCGGSCDGARRDACKYPFDVTCHAGSCVDGAGPDDQATSVLQATCIGNGRCPAEQQQLCGEDGCDAKNKLCNGACAVDKNACAKGDYCSAGECVPKLEVATACANDAQCGSNFCVDGVCCNKRCGDQCAACDVPGSVGSCTPAAGAAHGGRAACAGVGTCGAACDGQVIASCSFAGDTVSCGDAFCSAGVKGPAPRCDGDGSCAPAKTTACSSFGCDGAECSNACTVDSDCVKQFECRKGVCLPPLSINAVDQGSCGCSAPGSRSRSRAPASLWVLLGVCAAARVRRRRRLSS